MGYMGGLEAARQMRQLRESNNAVLAVASVAKDLGGRLAAQAFAWTIIQLILEPLRRCFSQSRLPRISASHAIRSPLTISVRSPSVLPRGDGYRDLIEVEPGTVCVVRNSYFADDWNFRRLPR